MFSSPLLFIGPTESACSFDALRKDELDNTWILKQIKKNTQL